MKRPTCPGCHRTVSIKEYLRTTYQRFLQCPGCHSNIEWHDVKSWHMYLYYNFLFLIVILSGFFERRFKIPHLVELMATVCIFGTLLGGYLLYHPKGTTNLSNSKKENFKFLARVWSGALSILFLTIIQYILIFIGLYKILGKELLN